MFGTQTCGLPAEVQERLCPDGFAGCRDVPLLNGRHHQNRVGTIFSVGRPRPCARAGGRQDLRELPAKYHSEVQLPVVPMSTRSPGWLPPHNQVSDTELT